jgi:1,2-phenylacetyl-CoA epoxidase PaaB subunit
MPTAESKVQAKIIKWLKSKNLYHVKHIQVNRRGIADLWVVYNGRVVAFEVKAEGKKPTTIQQYEAGQMFKYGGAPTFVVYSLKEVQTVIKERFYVS